MDLAIGVRKHAAIANGVIDVACGEARLFK